MPSTLHQRYNNIMWAQNLIESVTLEMNKQNRCTILYLKHTQMGS